MSAVRVLITGANGQLGTELRRADWPAGFAVTAVDRGELDITDATAVARALTEGGYALVVNAAAYTAVDKAESEPDRAFAVNRDGPANLARACAAYGAALVHVSTDYVFDGTKPTPYVEDDPVAPLGVYGSSKADGEAAVRAALPRHLILRTAWVYAAHGQNFVKTMLRLARERDELRVVADQVGCPTAARDLAAVIVALAPRLVDGPANAPLWGTYHAAGTGETSWHGFAEAIVSLAAPRLGRRPAVHAITTADYPTPACRPANSRLDGTKLAATFGVRLPDWRSSLAHTLDEIFEEVPS